MLKITRVRPNGKVDVRTADGDWVTLNADLSHAAGRYLSVEEQVQVVTLLHEAFC